MKEIFEKTGITEIHNKDFRNKYTLPSSYNSHKKVYSEDFKKQVVHQFLSGVSRKDLLEKYNISSSTFHNWVRAYKAPLEMETNGAPLEKQVNGDGVQSPNNISTEQYIQYLLQENEKLKKIILMLLHM